MIKTKTWIILFAVLAAVLLVVCLVIRNMGMMNTTARIIQDGNVLYEIDLSAVTEEYSFTIDCPDGGYNTVTVKPGMICVSQADCPDKICVKRGWGSGGVSPIVCMPHKLVISFEGSSETDALAG